MPDGDSKDPLSGILLLSLAIEIRQSKFGNSLGGIAQLVERQLCKLEVRGSNPLASSLRSRRREPGEPEQKSEHCRAVASAERTFFGLPPFHPRATTRQANCIFNL